MSWKSNEFERWLLCLTGALKINSFFIFCQVNIPLVHQLLKHGAKPSGTDGNALHLILLSASLNKESGKEIDLSQMFEEVYSISFFLLEKIENIGLTSFPQ